MTERSYNAMFTEDATPQISAVNPIVNWRKIKAWEYENKTDSPFPAELKELSIPIGAGSLKYIGIAVLGDDNYEGNDELTLAFLERETICGVNQVMSAETQTITTDYVDKNDIYWKIDFEELEEYDERYSSVGLDGTITVPPKTKMAIFFLVKPFNLIEASDISSSDILEEMDYKIYSIQSAVEQINQKLNPTTVVIVSVTEPICQIGENKIYNCGTLDTLNVAEPVNDFDASFTTRINFSSGATPTILISGSTVYSGDDCSNGIFTPAANKRYMLNISYDGIDFIGLVTAI